MQSRVTNIAEYLREALSVEQFIKILGDNIFSVTGNKYREYRLTAEDRQRIEELAEQRYRCWVWTFGLPPHFNQKNEKKFAGGTIALFLDVDNQGVIRTCKIHGDFFAVNDIAELETAFIGERYKQEELAAVVDRLRPAENYFINITDEEFLSCFF